LRLFSFGGYGLALVVFGAIECPPSVNANQLSRFLKKIAIAKDRVEMSAQR